MKQLKKTILTLVALLAVTTGAWADETLLLTINSRDYTSFTDGSKTFDDKVTVTFSDEIRNSGDDWGWYAKSPASLLTVAGTNGYTITSCKFYVEVDGDAITGYTIAGESPSVYLNNKEVYTDDSKSVYIGEVGITKIEVFGTAPSAASGPEVAWDEDKKTGTFKMPGGNVTLEPDYYPQATVAEGAVTAADDDARATTDDPLVKVDATKLTGAKKLMYFVSNSGTTAPAYDAEGWTDQLPTAEGLTQQGIVYVWYYPVGTDEGVDDATATYSDGDICLQSITARIAAAPTYAVTFAEGTEESDKWKANPATGVKKGETVTVTYTGSKKVIGVKAEKKAAPAAAEGHALSASVVGEIVGTDGKAYAAADKDNLPTGVTAVAMVAYKSATAGSSLAIALADEGSMNWNSAKSTCASKAAIGGKSWKLPTKDEWNQMFSANGGSTGLKTALSAAGGASSTLQNDYYWSSTEADDESAWLYSFGEGRWYYDDMVNGNQVRACLAF